ncbi:MAG: GNAT family N-acetyltransferase [Chloroflexota bacterium]|nr:GNAT family N-acetyltransferase [Chloroflexota bacterium]
MGVVGDEAVVAPEAGLTAAPLVLRRAVCGEARQLTALVLRSKAVWGYDSQFMRRAAAELVVSEQDIVERDVFVAQVGVVPAGVAGVDHAADPPELDLLFVDPIHKGTGIGRALLRHALAAARARGLSALAIVSDPYAEPFYISQGAIRVGAQQSSSTGRELPLLRITTDVAP